MVDTFPCHVQSSLGTKVGLNENRATITRAKPSAGLGGQQCGLYSNRCCYTPDHKRAIARRPQDPRGDEALQSTNQQRGLEHLSQPHLRHLKLETSSTKSRDTKLIYFEG